MKILGIHFLFIVSICIFLTCGSIAFAESTSSSVTNNTFVPSTDEELAFLVNTEGHQHIINIPVKEILFNVNPHFDQNGQVSSLTMTLKPELVELYHKLGYGNNKDNVFIYPVFTQAAYTQSGFYDYYNKKCDSKCLTVNIPDAIHGRYSSSI